MPPPRPRKKKANPTPKNLLAGDKGGAWTADTHLNFKASRIHNQGLARFITSHIRPKNFLEFGGGLALLANEIANTCELTDSYVIEPDVVAHVDGTRNLQLLNIDITSAPPPLELDRKFDLVLSIEVAEHIERSKHEDLFDFLAARAERWVVFSAARPGQGGHGHVAERPEAEWREEFVSRGFAFDARMTALARTLSDRKNINHCRNIQVFRAPQDHHGLDMLEARARPHLAELLRIVQSHGTTLCGNLFYVDLQAAIGARPAHSLRWKRENLMQFAAKASSILEVGFNAGHSALLFLLANPDAKILCVDNMHYPYTQACFDYLSATFGARISLIQGDSTEVLPGLPPSQFDFVHIDGGKHVTIHDDLRALRRLVVKDHVLAIDDTQNLALDAVITAHENRGMIETSPFAAANARSLRARWTHKLGRFVFQHDHTNQILAKIKASYKKSEHPSAYMQTDPDGQCIGKPSAGALVTAIRDAEAAGLRGAFVEVGVAAGHSSVIAALACSRYIPRDFYLFDTFRGFAELPDEKDHQGKSIRDYDLSMYATPDCTSGVVRSRMWKAGVAEDRLFVVEGLAEERVAEFAPEQIAILRLDVNLLAPTLASLEVMYDRLEKGGWLIIEDYGQWQGSREATDAFFAGRGETFRGEAINHTCHVMRK
jgi:O-methyltransferase